MSGGNLLKTHVQLIREDLKTGETVILADHDALRHGFTLVYPEEGTGVRHVIDMREDALIIQRQGEFPSRVELYSSGMGTCTVSSPYGEIRLQALLKKRSVEEDRWLVEYEVRDSGTVVQEVRFTWQFTT